MWGILVCSC